MTMHWKPGPEWQRRVALNANALLRVEDAGGWRLCVCRGTVLLSSYDRPEDILLPAGGAFTVPNDGLLLIEAIAAGEIRFDLPVQAGNRRVPASSRHLAGWHAQAIALLQRLVGRTAKR